MKKLLILYFLTFALAVRGQVSDKNRIAEKQNTSFSVGLVIRNLPDSLRLLEAEFRTSTSRLKKFSTLDGSIQKVSDTLYVFKFSNQDTRTYYGRGTWQVEIQTALTGARKTDVFNYEIYASITGAASTAPVNNSGYTYLCPLTFTSASVSLDVIASIPVVDGQSISGALNLKANVASPTFTGTVSGISKAMVGLGNADNTSDVNKPVSTAQLTALNLKAPLASPTFTGTVSGITKSMVGLGGVDNTSDLSKPISTLTQSALDTKAPIASPTFTGTVSGITKAMVGLSNADNTSDINKPISTATQTALNLKTAYVAVADMTAFNALSATPATVVIVDVASDTVRNSGNPSRYEIWPSGRKWWNASIPIN